VKSNIASGRRQQSNKKAERAVLLLLTSASAGSDKLFMCCHADAGSVPRQATHHLLLNSLV